MHLSHHFTPIFCKKTRKNKFYLCSAIQIAFIQKLLSTLTRNRNIQRNNCISHCWLKVKIKLKMTPFSSTFPFSLQIQKYNFFKFMAHFSPFQLLVTFPIIASVIKKFMAHFSTFCPFLRRSWKRSRVHSKTSFYFDPFLLWNGISNLSFWRFLSQFSPLKRWRIFCEFFTLHCLLNFLTTFNKTRLRLRWLF